MNPFIEIIWKCSEYISNNIGFLSYPLTAISLIIVILFAYLARHQIGYFFKSIDKKALIAIITIFLLALTLRMAIPPLAHIMYDDEHEYMFAAKNMLRAGNDGQYIRSTGWPYLLSISFLIFGISAFTAIYTSLVLSALTAVNIFVLCYAITRRKGPSLIAAFAFSLMGASIRWAGSAETTSASIFFVTATMAAMAIYLKQKNKNLLMLTIALSVFTSMIRPENLLMPIWVFICLCIFESSTIKKNLKACGLIIFAVLVVLLPNAANVLNVELVGTTLSIESNGVLSGDDFSLKNTYTNTIEYGIHLFDNTFMPLIFTGICALGFVMLLFDKKKWALITLAWSFPLYLIYFTSYFQTLGGGMNILNKDRFFLTFYPVSCVWLTFGLQFIAKSLTKITNKGWVYGITLMLLCIILGIFFMPYVLNSNQDYDSSELITRIPSDINHFIPDGCNFVTGKGLYFAATTDLNLIDSSQFLWELENGIYDGDCTIFFEGIECISPGLYDPKYRMGCAKILNLTHNSVFMVYERGNAAFVVYNLSKADNGAAYKD